MGIHYEFLYNPQKKRNSYIRETFHYHVVTFFGFTLIMPLTSKNLSNMDKFCVSL
ncbi:hypothetical protein RO3G_07264 [Rhizopus delemar RA 99-880]|uniref:Uncharacterized protein n=1 Tax=Rhizopus delemar (strain RA 99-880 / ATCC MYA-4621 / FGSC 9543 / NRRL 43880) TaxID=246409 RepID=I1C279_RHIO9|nr:hypothetical protein RO3G_07264 [Rhizopus delemar RA 99-880]|eukprot:EIE82559.1 hypothetical protein RO3G_07264 [Rhizopus delemar RA 99-880]